VSMWAEVMICLCRSCLPVSAIYNHL